MKITVVDLGDLAKPFGNPMVKTTSAGSLRVEIYTNDGVVGMAPISAAAEVLGSYWDETLVEKQRVAG